METHVVIAGPIPGLVGSWLFFDRPTVVITQPSLRLVVC